MQKRVAIIIEDGRIGGPQKQLIYFLNNLKNKKEIKFTIIYQAKYINKFKKQILNKKINYIPFNFSNLDKKNIINYSVNFFKEVFFLVKIFKVKNFNIIYIAGGSINFKSALSSILSNKKFVWHVHDTRCNFLIKIIFKFLNIFSFKTIFASNKSQKYYNFNEKKKSQIINSSVPIPKKIDLNKKDKYIKVALIGNINPDKNILLYKKIVSNNHNKKIKFFLVGQLWSSQINYFKKINLKKIIKNNKLKWIKNLSNTNNFISKIDILICTSKYESLPLSICEAMSYGKFIISTDVGDVKKYILNKKFKCGEIIQSNDPNDFNIYINKFSQNPKIFQSYKLNAYFIAKKFLNINIFTDKILNLLNK